MTRGIIIVKVLKILLRLGLHIGSDGRMFSSLLLRSDSDEKPLGDLFTVIESVSTKSPVAMASLNENYLAIYGANTNEEGAVLIIYNTQFKVNQTKQPFKLYTSGTKLWSIDNNLMLPVGQNLAVVPFCLYTEQLAALVGSHKVVENDPDISIVEELEMGRWDTDLNLKKHAVPQEINIMLPIIKRGVPEYLMLEQLLPEIFEKERIDQLEVCLNCFSDISEKCLVKILTFLLKVDEKLFSNNTQHASALFPSGLQPAERCRLIDLILMKSFSDVLLLSHLRIELDIEHVVMILNYICFMFSDDGHTLPTKSAIETEAKLINWGCVLIDSNYQKLLLSRDSKISDVLIKFNNLVKDELESMEDLKQVVPILNQFLKGKSVTQPCVRLKYSVEQLTMY